MEVSDICPLCDREPETSYHAIVTCPRAQGLRVAMREHWRLPDEEQFRYTGPDWLLLLLDQCSATERDLTKLLLWKTWSVHNNITHHSGSISISEAVHGLCSMQATLSDILLEQASAVGKGKLPCPSPGNRKSTGSVLKVLGPTDWEPPPTGWTKINVDGSFVSQSGEAGIGIIARDSEHQVVFTAWRVLFRCQDALEAEARACLEGLRLSAPWSQGPVIVETDCARLIQALEAKEDRSSIRFLLAEIKDQAQLLPEWRVDKVKRECNLVAHELAHLARRNIHTAVWLGRTPACVHYLVKNDCNPSI